MYNWWKSDEPDMIIRMADADDINFIFKDGHNRIPIGPTERAVFIKDGKMLGTIDQDTIKIADEWEEEKIHTVHWKKEKSDGKIKRFIGRLTGKKKEEDHEERDYIETIRKRVLDGYIHVLFVDATTIDMKIPISESDGVYTGDSEEHLTGNMILRFEFAPLETPKQLRLLSRDKSLSVGELRERLRDEIISEAVKPVLNSYEADEIYGNREVRESSEMAVLHELKKTLGHWGIDIQKVIANWDTPERVRLDHKLALKKAEIDREIATREMERVKETREREYGMKIEGERLDFEIKKREKALTLAKTIEDAKIEVADKRNDLEDRKQRARIDRAAYMLEIMNLKRREREINQMELRRQRIEMDTEREWERHKMAMDREEKRAYTEIDREYKKHLAGIESTTLEHTHAKEMTAISQAHKVGMKEKELEARRIAAEERMGLVQVLGDHGGIGKGQVDVADVLRATGDEAEKIRAEAVKSETDGKGDLYSAAAMGVKDSAGAVMTLGGEPKLTVIGAAKDESTSKNTMAELRELTQMYRNGLLDEAEFRTMKKKLMG